jgi:outer membrane protein OmpA-like peptidoglycan-associated protein
MHRNMHRTIRQALLGGIMLPAAALAQATTSQAFDGGMTTSREGAIILAQAPAPAPADTTKQKGTPPKAAPPKAAPPPGAPARGAQGGPGAGGAPGGGAPGGGAPGAAPRAVQGGPPAQQGTPPGQRPGQHPGQRPGDGVQTQHNAAPPAAAQAPAAAPTPTNTPNAAPGAPGQGKQFRAQPKGNVPGTPPGNPPVQGQNAAPGAPPNAAPQFRQPAQVQQPVQGQQNAAPGAVPNVAPQNRPPLQGQHVVPGAAPAPGAAAAPQNGVPPRQFGGQPPQQPPGRGFAGPQGRPPAAAAVMNGNVEQMRTQRHEHTEPGGRVVIEEPGRTIVREGKMTIIRHDETERFRAWGGDPRIERRGNEQFAYIGRPGGYQIVTVTGTDGRMLRRIRRGPDGREVVLIDNGRPGIGIGVGVAAGVAAGFVLGLAAPVINIPREQYIVDTSAAPPPMLYETLEAPPLVAIERAYSLDEIKYNVALRDRMRRIDIDAITFDTGSWDVTPEQQPKLEVVAEAIRRIVSRSPDEVFLIEGHTDAVGNDVDNLSLSDHRAESVAAVLTEAFQIPPENLVTQGYGEQFPKIQTEGPSRENRRVTVRRITPLLHGAVASR